MKMSFSFASKLNDLRHRSLPVHPCTGVSARPYGRALRNTAASKEASSGTVSGGFRVRVRAVAGVLARQSRRYWREDKRGVLFESLGINYVTISSCAAR